MKRLNKSKKPGMFDIIAPVYDLFYNHQKKKFRVYLDQISDEWGLNFYPKIVDIGCGTGALASVLNELGHDVTAVDASPRMLLMGEKRPENSNIHFLLADAKEQLPFADHSFDIAVTSFVAHGLQSQDRKALYREMKRLAKSLIIIYDYNQRRSLIINIAEWMEQGDYFNFIKVAETEMGEIFTEVKTITAGNHSTWYICKP